MSVTAPLANPSFVEPAPQVALEVEREGGGLRLLLDVRPKLQVSRPSETEQYGQAGIAEQV
jgi:hypothetical protein